MPCSRHPNRPSKCRCFNLCSECVSMHPEPCRCEKSHAEREIPKDLKPPKLERQKARLNLMEPTVPALNLALVDDMLHHIEKENEEKDKATEEMIGKLSARYNNKMREWDEYKRAYDKEMAEYKEAQRMLEIERAQLEEELASRERAKLEVEAIQAKLEENKKKLKKAVKQKKAEKEGEKWKRLSSGKSAK